MAICDQARLRSVFKAHTAEDVWWHGDCEIWHHRRWKPGTFAAYRSFLGFIDSQNTVLLQLPLDIVDSCQVYDHHTHLGIHSEPAQLWVATTGRQARLPNSNLRGCAFRRFAYNVESPKRALRLLKFLWNLRRGCLDPRHESLWKAVHKDKLGNPVHAEVPALASCVMYAQTAEQLSSLDPKGWTLTDRFKSMSQHFLTLNPSSQRGSGIVQEPLLHNVPNTPMSMTGTRYPFPESNMTNLLYHKPVDVILGRYSVQFWKTCAHSDKRGGGDSVAAAALDCSVKHVSKREHGELIITNASMVLVRYPPPSPAFPLFSSTRDLPSAGFPHATVSRVSDCDPYAANDGAVESPASADAKNTSANPLHTGGSASSFPAGNDAETRSCSGESARELTNGSSRRGPHLVPALRTSHADRAPDAAEERSPSAASSQSKSPPSKLASQVPRGTVSSGRRSSATLTSTTPQASVAYHVFPFDRLSVIYSEDNHDSLGIVPRASGDATSLASDTVKYHIAAHPAVKSYCHKLVLDQWLRACTVGVQEIRIKLSEAIAPAINRNRTAWERQQRDALGRSIQEGTDDLQRSPRMHTFSGRSWRSLDRMRSGVLTTRRRNACLSDAGSRRHLPHASPPTTHFAHPKLPARDPAGVASPNGTEPQLEADILLMEASFESENHPVHEVPPEVASPLLAGRGTGLGTEPSAHGALPESILPKASLFRPGSTASFDDVVDESVDSEQSSSASTVTLDDREAGEAVPSFLPSAPLSLPATRRLLHHFQSIDPTGFGTVREPEFQKALGPLLRSSKLPTAFFRAFDTDHNGVITFLEFVTGLTILMQAHAPDKLTFVFFLFDGDGDGCVSKAEFAEMFGLFLQLGGVPTRAAAGAEKEKEEGLSRKAAADVFDAIDTDHDGCMTLVEFRDAVLKNQAVCAAFKRLRRLAADQPVNTGSIAENDSIVAFGHESWPLVIDVLAGLLESRMHDAKRDRALSDEERSAEKVKFLKAFNAETRSLSYNFRPCAPDYQPNQHEVLFTDYAPSIFDEIRELNGISSDQYLQSLGLHQVIVNLLTGSLTSLKQLVTSGSSGQFFFASHDDRFILKTISATETRTLRRMLPAYLQHLKDNPDTLITRYYRLAAINRNGRKVSFVIMGNVFLPETEIKQVYDLKGSSVGRTVPFEKRKKSVALKDLDLKRQINLDMEWHEQLVHQLKRDVQFLRANNLTDYSFLVAVDSNRTKNADGTVFDSAGKLSVAQKTAREDPSANLGKTKSSSRCFQCTALTSVCVPCCFGMKRCLCQSKHKKPLIASPPDTIQHTCETPSPSCHPHPQKLAPAAEKADHRAALGRRAQRPGANGQEPILRAAKEASAGGAQPREAAAVQHIGLFGAPPAARRKGAAPNEPYGGGDEEARNGDMEPMTSPVVKNTLLHRQASDGTGTTMTSSMDSVSDEEPRSTVAAPSHTRHTLTAAGPDELDSDATTDEDEPGAGAGARSTFGKETGRVSKRHIVAHASTTNLRLAACTAEQGSAHPHDQQPEVSSFPRRTVFQSCCGGIPSSDRNEIFYVGIIDVLTDYNVLKSAESAYKAVIYGSAASAKDPDYYGDRFLAWLDCVLEKKGDAQYVDPGDLPHDIQFDASLESNTLARIVFDVPSKQFVLYKVPSRKPAHELVRRIDGYDLTDETFNIEKPISLDRQLELNVRRRPKLSKEKTRLPRVVWQHSRRLKFKTLWEKEQFCSLCAVLQLGAREPSPAQSLRTPFSLSPSSDAGSAWDHEPATELLAGVRTKPVLVYTGTWNVGEAAPGQPSDLEEWLGSARLCDIVAVAAQECHYKTRGRSESCAEDWLVTILFALNQVPRQAGGDPAEASTSIAEHPWTSDQYVVVDRVDMWEMRLAIFVRRRHVPSVSNLTTHCVPTGIAHIGGNKGGIAVGMKYLETPIVFICCHLAAHQENVFRRHNDIDDILYGLSASMGTSRLQLATEFPHVFILGDLNYRIDTAEDSRNLYAARDLGEAPAVAFRNRGDVLQAIVQKNWPLLQKEDQLIKAMSGRLPGEKQLLPHFVEAGPIVHSGAFETCPAFPPTFKVFSKFSKAGKRKHGINLKTDYQGFAKGGVARVPSWCDRILRSVSHPHRIEQDVRTLEYASSPSISTSDHKPVHARFALRAREQYIFDIGSRDLNGAVLEPQPTPRAATVILLSQLSAESIAPCDPSGKSDPYLAVFSRLISNTSLRTQTRPKTVDPVWSAVITIVPEIGDVAFIASEYIYFAIFNEDIVSDDIIGQAVLCLEPFVGKKKASEHSPFVLPIYCDGRREGTLRGCVKVYDCHDPRSGLKTGVGQPVKLE
ncbi:hypothetical protein DIPPA_20452 [Diplonema papillatum]|nr:hypothetical protein DIPPA_20452 [Diplonema papillatum]|eukprot:gene20401-31397_t